MILGPCRVVRGGPAPAVLDQAGVRIAGAHIAQVGPLAPLLASHPREQVWDTGGRVLLPGLVDAHAHLARHLARGLGLEREADWECYDRALAPDDVLWAAMAALGEGLRHGITTTYDVHRSAGCLDLSLTELANAAERIGVRLATCYAVDERDPASDRAAALREGASLARDLKRRRSGRLQAMTGLRARTWPGLDALLEEVSASANEAPLHVELASAPAMGERGSARPSAGSGCLWSHAERAPLALVSEARARGDAMVWARAGAWDHGADPDLAWGSDDGVHAPPRPPEPGSPDLWRRSELYYSRVWVSGPRWAARHFGEGLGTIEAGAPADLMLADYHPATPLDQETLPAHAAAGLARAPIWGVMVAGEVLMDRGVLTQVDEVEIAARAREGARRLWRRLG
jgi:cytosine/adenosine deaminase-related metal-dependent hydrolase